MAKKKVTLESLDKKFDKRFTRLERLMEAGFSAVADDISKLATKEDVVAVHTQVNSIERNQRETKAGRRLADLEENAFGKVRA